MRPRALWGMGTVTAPQVAECSRASPSHCCSGRRSTHCSTRLPWRIFRMPRFHTGRAVDNRGHEPAGGRTTGHEDDDWWGQLYDDSTEDTGPTPATDSLDDRFASAAGTVRSASTAGDTGGAGRVSVRALPASRCRAPARTTWPRRRPDRLVDLAGRAADSLAPHRPGRHRPAPAGRPCTRRHPGHSSAGTAPRPLGTAVGHASRPHERPVRSATTRLRRTRAPRPRPLRDRRPHAHETTARRLETSGTPSPPAPSTPPPTPPPPSPLPPPPALPPRPTPKDYVGSGPPTYDAQPTALPLADPDDLDDLVADTVLDGARYGAFALRAVSVRGTPRGTGASRAATRCSPPASARATTP